jgi:hypothetical protein
MGFRNLEGFFQFQDGRLGRRTAQGMTLNVDAFFPVRQTFAAVRAAKEELLTSDELCPHS